jgi:hypothetical protein
MSDNTTDEDQSAPPAKRVEPVGRVPRYAMHLTNAELLQRGAVARQILLQLGYSIVESARPMKDTDMRKDVYKYKLTIRYRFNTHIKDLEDTQYPVLVGMLLYDFVDELEAKQHLDDKIANGEAT